MKATNLTARHRGQTSPAKSSEPTKSNHTGTKQRKQEQFPLLIVGAFFALFLLFHVMTPGGGDPYNPLEEEKKPIAVEAVKATPAKATPAKATPAKASSSSTSTLGYPYEGWQPGINWEQDKSQEKCQSWRTCLKKDHGCPAKCRESYEDLGKPPPRPGFRPDPGADDDETYNAQAQAVEWIPDVTVLRRMLKAGKDENGNPWPPPLVTETDRELCEEIGNMGQSKDDHMKLFNAVPIRGMPLLEEWDEARAAATKMKRQPRVLCTIYTMEQNHHTNIRAIRETWGPGCDGFLAFSTKDDPRLPAISIPHDGPEEYKNMWQKIRSMWRFVGTHYLEDFDFFFQGGEDMFVMPQNLRHYLANAVEDPDKDDLFAGRRFRFTEKLHFNSGGAGYALSRSTLRKLMEGLDDEICQKDKKSAMEDVIVARCLKNKFNITVVDTRDDQERERFHPFAPAGHYNWHPPPDGKKTWYVTYNQLWPPKLKEMCCAPDSVSFHYIKKTAMVRHLHALLYFCD